MQSLLTGAMQHKTLLYESQSTESGARLPEVNLNYTISHGNDWQVNVFMLLCSPPLLQ